MRTPSSWPKRCTHRHEAQPCLSTKVSVAPSSNRQIALTRCIIAKSGRIAQRDNISNLPSSDRSHHIFMPFFGGIDVQVALRLVLQLAENPEVTATICHYQMKGEDTISTEHVTAKGLPDGKICISSYAEDTDDTFFFTIQRTLPDALRLWIAFRTNSSCDPVQDAVADARSEVGQKRDNGGGILFLARNVHLVESQTSTCLGLVTDVILEKNVKARMVVVQARR
jgi:hypothetical protein